MKIFVLGKNGMLGRYVYTYLKEKEYNVTGWTRKDFDVTNYNESQLKMELLHIQGVESGDVIINCVGVIKPMVDKYGTLNAIKVNSLFPHYLSNVCVKEGYKMLHITTDCVFSGKDGNYDENSPHDALDVYGKTKSLGEPENCTVLRTSIIGEEIGQGRSLIEWIKSMRNKEANGFTNHNWNGITCLQVAKIFEEIINENKFWLGVKHVVSPNIVNKEELLQMVSDVYKLNIKVNPVEAQIYVDRTMKSNSNLLFDVPDLKIQIEEMCKFKLE